MKPYLGAQSTITVGAETVLESNSPDESRGVVFEDDGDTGYFYARDFTVPDTIFVDALHIYNVAGVTDRHLPSAIKIIWTRDFMVAALLINQRPFAIFNFEECCGYAKSPFPEPDLDSNWTHAEFNSSQKELFHPTK